MVIIIYDHNNNKIHTEVSDHNNNNIHDYKQTDSLDESVGATRGVMASSSAFLACHQC